MVDEGLHPGLMVGQGADGVHLVVGPQDAVTVRHPGRLKASLKQSGAVRGARHATALRELYETPELSRTVSYLESITRRPDDTLKAVAILRGLSVCLVGAGGLGSNTALMLAGMGVRRFILIDHDKIEASNLNRQFAYSRADRGRYKVDVLARQLRARFNSLQIQRVRGKLKDGGAMRPFLKADLIICTADDPPDLMNRIPRLMPKRSVCISAGYLFSYGVVKQQLALARSARDELLWHSSRGSIAPSSGPSNLFLSSIIGFWVFDLVKRKAEGRSLRPRQSTYDFSAL